MNKIDNVQYFCCNSDHEPAILLLTLSKRHRLQGIWERNWACGIGAEVSGALKVP